jgi:MFS family permease
VNRTSTPDLARLTAAPLAVTAPSAAPSARRVAGRPALYLLASLIVSLLAASAAPTPLYATYAREWGFTPVTTTVIFGAYAVTVLAALLTLGRMSDYLGRRPVLLAALAIQVLSLLVFTTASGTAELLVARIIQGLSTGAALGAIGAGMLDIDRERGAFANALSPGLGTGTGALVSALLVRYLPAPTHLVYLALLAVIIAQAIGVALLRETVTRTPLPRSAVIPDVRLPRSVRGPVLAAAPVLFAVWALAGLYGALGPALVGALTGSASEVLGGLSLTTLTVTAVSSVYLLRNVAARTVMLAGIIALVAGVAITLAALAAGSPALFFAGTAVSGAGFGSGFQGGIRTVVPQAAPRDRAGLLSVLFTFSYLGMGVPAVGAGLLAVHGAGLLGAARYYGIALIVLAALALAGLYRTRVRPAAGQ